MSASKILGRVLRRLPTHEGLTRATFLGETVTLKPGESKAVFSGVPFGSYLATANVPVEIRLDNMNFDFNAESKVQIEVKADELTKVQLP